MRQLVCVCRVGEPLTSEAISEFISRQKFEAAGRKYALNGPLSTVPIAEFGTCLILPFAGPIWSRAKKAGGGSGGKVWGDAQKNVICGDWLPALIPAEV